MNKIIAITMGDGSGIGPEVIAKALTIMDMSGITPVIIGDFFVQEHAFEKFTNLTNSLNQVESIYDIEDNKINILDLNNLRNKSIQFGQISSETGKASVNYIFKAIELALDGKIDAIATAPISKAAIRKAGFDYDGHTEILAEKTNSNNYAMSFFSPEMNVILVTTHVAHKDVTSIIDKELILNKIILAHQSMQDLGIENPKIAVLGLNPHAGEGGIFGNEEEKHIIPAIREAKHLNIDIDGPIPSDTAFTRDKLQKYDMFVAMYHDQGLIPLKMLAFDKAVNVTLGLPIIRTSVDHGTAFEIAGKGIADAGSMIEAIKLAVKFAHKNSISE